MVGLIPLFATEVIDRRLLANVPRFRERLRQHKGGAFQGNYVCACPDWENERGEHLLALVDHTMLPRILSHLLSERRVPLVLRRTQRQPDSRRASRSRRRCPASARR